MTMFNELVKLIPGINKAVHDGTRHVLAQEELTYEECEPFLPLRDGDVVFCPSCYDGDSFRLTWTDGSDTNLGLWGDF